MLALLRVNKRMFSCSTLFRMPRGVRPERNTAKVDEVEEIDENKSEETSDWNYLVNKRNLSDDNRLMSHFGTVRFDKDNAPSINQEFIKMSEKDKEDRRHEETQRSFYVEKKYEKENVNAEVMFLENDVDTALESKITPFISEKEASTKNKEKKKKVKVKNKNVLTEDTDKLSKVKIEKKMKIYEDTNTLSANSSDLNYFDELNFGDSFRKFDGESVDTSRQIKPGPVSGELNSMFQDLDYVDAQYLSQNRDLNGNLSPSENVLPNNIDESNIKIELSIQEDANFIDSQYFGFEKEDIPNKNIETTNHKNKFETKIREPILDNIEVFPKENVKNKQKDIDKSYKQKSKQAQTYSALSYVKDLRKQNESKDRQSSEFMKDPVMEISRNISSRISAASIVHTNALAKSKLEDQSDDIEIKDGPVYTDIKKYQPPNLRDYTRHEVLQMLSNKILYDDNEIVGLWKPYGLSMFGSKGSENEISLEKFLPELSEKLGHKNLLEVHRLDSTTTGVVLLATSEARRKHLKQMFAAKKIVKCYYAITNGVPNPKEGVINIPIGEGKIGERYRSTLRPDYSSKENKIITNKKTSRVLASAATTEYRVLSYNHGAALIEVLMLSGVKHQIRVHLGLGLGTPIIGDNKYSWPDQIGPPQRVKGAIVNRLGLKKSRTRNLPIFLHSKRISIPEVLTENKILTIQAVKPHFFNKMQKRLKLSEDIKSYRAIQSNQ